jgi:hypothetical protein
MTRHRKLIAAGLLTAALAASAGTAMAADSGTSGSVPTTKSYLAPHPVRSGESGTTDSKTDSGAPGLSQGGAPGSGTGDNVTG